MSDKMFEDVRDDDLEALVRVGDMALAELARRKDTREEDAMAHELAEPEVDSVTRLSFDDVMRELRRVSYQAGFSSWGEAFVALDTGELDGSVFKPDLQMYSQMLRRWEDSKQTKDFLDEVVAERTARNPHFPDLVVEAQEGVVVKTVKERLPHRLGDARPMPVDCVCLGTLDVRCFEGMERSSIRRIDGHCICCPARPPVGDGTLASYGTPIAGKPFKEKKISKRKKPMPLKLREFIVWGPGILGSMRVDSGALRDRTKRDEDWVRSLRVGRMAFANGRSVRRVK